MKKLIIISLFISQFSFAEELKIITPSSYIAENPTIERKSIVDFLQKQFDNHQGQIITQEKLDLFWKNTEVNFNKMRFQIINQKLYADIDKQSFMHVEYFPKIVNFLQNILKHYYIKDVDFIILHAENVSRLIEFPIFNMSSSNSEYEKNIFLFPDFYMMDSWQNLIDKVDIAKSIYPWEKKINQIFWRGLTTGALSSLGYMPYYDIELFDKFPRLTLVMLSKLYPNLIDAKFSYYIGKSDKPNQKDLQILFDKLSLVSSDYVDEEDHLKYKYLISIDGYACAWKRVPWIMSSNSALVKQETHRTQWFYPALKPYVNYIPVKEDLSDILSQIEWMKAHDKEVKEISNNAQNFIKNDLMPENIEAHTSIILNQYHNLHKDTKIIPTLPTAEEALKEAEEKKELERELKKGKFVQFRNKVRKKINELWSHITIF